MENIWGPILKNSESDMKEMIKAYHSVDVNLKDIRGCTLLHRCCQEGHATIILVLLSHPDIDVNQRDHDGYTPFMWACNNGKSPCARVLLKDPRVSVTQANVWGYTPLQRASLLGSLDLVKFWIASGREMDLGQPEEPESDAIQAAEKMEPWHGGEQRKRKSDIATLLKDFREDPEPVRSVVRQEVAWFDELAADFFALVIFFSEGLLQVSPGHQTTTPAARFLKISCQLPLELQMVLCFRLMGSGKDLIAGKHTEVAFKELGQRCY